MEKNIEVRAVSILLGALTLAVVIILVFASQGKAQPAPEADLSLDKHDFPDPVAVGDRLGYNLRASNLGPNVASNSTITDVLPANVVLLGIRATEDVSCTSAGNVVTCDLGDLGPGIEAFVSIDVCPTAPGTLTNTATVSSATPDPAPANNTATATTTVIPETPEPCPEPDPGPGPPGPGPDPGPDPGPGPGPGDQPHVGPEPPTSFAPSFEASQDADVNQDSGSIEQQMEGSPGGTQNANTGNFANPDQDIHW